MTLEKGGITRQYGDPDEPGLRSTWVTPEMPEVREFRSQVVSQWQFEELVGVLWHFEAGLNLDELSRKLAHVKGWRIYEKEPYANFERQLYRHLGTLREGAFVEKDGERDRKARYRLVNFPHAKE